MILPCFNKKRKGKYKKIDVTKIEKIIVNKSSGKVVYKHIIEKRKNKEVNRLVELVYNGSIKLFTREYNSNIPGITQHSSHSTPFGSLNVSSTNSGSSFNARILYLKKKNKKYVTDISTAKIGGRTEKSFRKYLSNYFKNCPQLQKKIIEEELTKNDIIVILEFYDNKCYNLDKN